jgi:hypothetical protein
MAGVCAPVSEASCAPIMKNDSIRPEIVNGNEGVAPLRDYAERRNFSLVSLQSLPGIENQFTLRPAHGGQLESAADG